MALLSEPGCSQEDPLPELDWKGTLPVTKLSSTQFGIDIPTAAPWPLQGPTLPLTLDQTSSAIWAVTPEHLGGSIVPSISNQHSKNLGAKTQPRRPASGCQGQTSASHLRHDDHACENMLVVRSDPLGRVACDSHRG